MKQLPMIMGIHPKHQSGPFTLVALITLQFSAGRTWQNCLLIMSYSQLSGLVYWKLKNKIGVPKMCFESKFKNELEQGGREKTDEGIKGIRQQNLTH